jgi:thiamine-phosphate pyrophosphorylase
MSLFRFLLVSDSELLPLDRLVWFVKSLSKQLPYGLLAVQIREKALDSKTLLSVAKDMALELRDSSVKVLVNDRLDIAIASGAHGVHLPSSGLQPDAVRRRFKGLVGVSAHSCDELQSLQPAHVDYATFGPVFKTPKKLSFGPPQGTQKLRIATSLSRVPVFAIGGISEENAHLLKGTGIHGVACIRAVLSSKDPARTVLKILSDSELLADSR